MTNKHYIFYNSADSKHNSSEYAELFSIVLETEPEFIDICDEYQPKSFLGSYEPGRCAIICGGDNTLSWFINHIYPSADFAGISFCTCDTGSDFSLDINAADVLIDITEHLRHLPSAIVNFRDYKFINGIGFGLDVNFYDSTPVYANLIGKLRAKGKIPPKEYVFRYDPVDIEAEVDGVRYTFENVWVAPIMNGRYYSDGMMIAPNQDRSNEDGTLSLVVLHNAKKWRAFRILKSLYRERDRSGCRKLDILCGCDITVRLSKPANIHLDGNTLFNVDGYHATALPLTDR